MKPKVYVETSIFSFYFDERPAAQIAARREWTRQWWEKRSSESDLFTSTITVGELRRGSLPHREHAEALAASLPMVVPEATEDTIAAVYIRRFVMPRVPSTDALHLAIASIHKADFLVTWNCRHLANAQKYRHIEVVNRELGLYVPCIVTPLELLAEDAEA